MDSDLSPTITPKCSYYGQCGGCQLQHLDYVDQLKFKKQQCIEKLNSLVNVENIRDVISSPSIWEYRRRIQLHVGAKGQIGFFGVGSQKVIEVDRCPIAAPELNQAFAKVRDLAQEDLHRRSRPTMLSYELTLQEDHSVEISRRESLRSFLQNNPAANELLLNFLLKAFSDLQTEHVLELFAGSGNFTQALSHQSKTWLAIESNALSIELAKESCTNPSVQWQEGSVEKALKKSNKFSQKFDLVLMDPPRQGLQKSAERLLKLRAPFLLYVSCDLNSLRRDLHKITQGDYEVLWVQPFDFFPQTSHLETLSLCRLNKAR